MRLRRTTAFLIAALLAAPLAGCYGGRQLRSYPRQDPFAVRPYQLESGGRWIGNAICYGPHRDGQRPGGISPSAAEIREDLHLMLPHWNLMRIYGSSGFAELLLKIIREDALEMKVMLGAWIGSEDLDANRIESDAAIRLANEYPEIVSSVCVGNETQIFWASHRCSPEILIEHLRRVRAGVSVPVTTADDFNYWNKSESRAVAAEVDFITTHAHPLWNGQQLEAGLSWLRKQLAEIQAMHPDRAIVIGETGWATSVHDEGEQAELIKGQPGEGEQKQFHAEVRAWAEKERLPLFWFEAFDENWKGGPHPNEVEKHWGLFGADRAAKAAMTSDGGE